MSGDNDKKNWLERWPERLLGCFPWITLALVVVGACLNALDTEVPGLGDLLSFETDNANLKAMLAECWGRCGELLTNSRTSLWVDSILFVPLYVTFLLCFQRRFFVALRGDVHATWMALAPITLMAGVLDLIENATSLIALRESADPSRFPWIYGAIRVSAYAKWGLVVLSVASAAWLFLAWFFKDERAQLRHAAVDIVWRTKYALLVTTLFGFLILVMKQPHDAIIRQFLDCPDNGGCRFGLLDYVGLVVTLLAISGLSTVGWYWPRAILRLRSPGSDGVSLGGAEAFARWWARMLGLAPLLLTLVFVLSIPRPEVGDHAISHLLLVAGVIALVVLFLVLTASRRGSEGSSDKAPCYYYNCVSEMQDVRKDLKGLSKISAWVPPILFVLSRGLSEVPGSPPLAFAVLCSGLATWAGIGGWLAYESRVRTAPFVLVVVLLVAGIGLWGGSEIHQVLAAGEFSSGRERALQLWRLLTILLVGIVLVTGSMAFFKRRTDPKAKCVFGWVAVGWLSTMSTAIIFDSKIIPSLAMDRLPPEPGKFTDSRPSLHGALQDWLIAVHNEICGATPDDHCRSAGFREREPVYFVSAEGGGIRAAYWTALVLSRLHDETGGKARIFSISGVSGGSIGAATYVACARQSKDSLKDCIHSLGQADLLTQTFGAALFEDAVASVFPTSLFCNHPGCGVFGRSYWFEGKLENAVPALGNLTVLHPMSRRSDGASAADARSTENGAPHLFLNATRVETGQRAIASTVRIDSESFPTAVDQIGVVRHDIRLSTAGHNSARFPYVNPVAAAFGFECPEDKPLRVQVEPSRERTLCQHWVDGGYLDNSGAHTTADILRVLRACLDGIVCKRLSMDVLNVLRARIAPVVISITNGAPKVHPCYGKGSDSCSMSRNDSEASPRRPPLRFLTNQIAPPSALVAVAVSSATLAEARLEREANLLWREFGVDSNGSAKSFRRIEHASDGKAIYPLGWMLSSRAQRHMASQAELIPGSAFQVGLME